MLKCVVEIELHEGSYHNTFSDSLEDYNFASPICYSSETEHEHFVGIRYPSDCSVDPKTHRHYAFVVPWPVQAGVIVNDYNETLNGRFHPWNSSQCVVFSQVPHKEFDIREALDG